MTRQVKRQLEREAIKAKTRTFGPPPQKCNEQRNLLRRLYNLGTNRGRKRNPGRR